MSIAGYILPTTCLNLGSLLGQIQSFNDWDSTLQMGGWEKVSIHNIFRKKC